MRNEFEGDFKLTERDNKLHDYATRYHTECEDYDRTVCTGRITQDGIMPATQCEVVLISRNAQTVRKDILFDAECDGFSQWLVCGATAIFVAAIFAWRLF